MDQIFFHLNAYGQPVPDGDSVVFEGNPSKAPRIPSVGDRVVFCAVEGTKGWKASLWTFADEISMMTQELSRNYMVWEQLTIVDRETQPPTDLKFEGSLRNLVRRFPRTKNSNLDIFAASGNADASTSFRFERQADDDLWERCDDPRRVVDAPASRRR
ncbi:MAG: hypothetical protein V1664_03775 [Candidatus Uhrbacteria bacterium]